MDVEMDSYPPSNGRKALELLEKGKGGECVICGKWFEGYGNNAQPLKEGRCCDSCNMKVIIERYRRGVT